MEQRANFLALMLLDALEDENEQDVRSILERNNADASYVPRERGMAPIHYTCGMANEKLGLDILKTFLQHGADSNVRCDGNMTALHIAAIHGRIEHVRLLLEYGANIDLLDDDNKLAVHYAIEECHFEVLQLMRDHIFLEKYKQKKAQKRILQENCSDCHKTSSFPNGRLEKQLGSTSTPHNLTPVKQNIASTSKELVNKTLFNVSTNEKYTPNKIHYNYDVTSPYYINITHRRHKPQPKYPPESAALEQSLPEITPVNIFSLTRENLADLTNKTTPAERSRASLINVWRTKVEGSRARKSLLQQFHIEELVDEAIENEDFCYEAELKKKQLEIEADSGAETSSDIPIKKETPKAINKIPEIVQQIAAAQQKYYEPVLPNPSESSYHTAAAESEIEQKRLQIPEEDVTRRTLIRSPKSEEYYLQMKEAYVHTDDENGLVFYETKLVSNIGNKVAQKCTAIVPPTGGKTTELESTVTSHSTEYTLPVDYETDDLRKELTQFGEHVGPITKTTKRLYIKRLVKYKRNFAKMLEVRQRYAANEIKYSVELQRTVRCAQAFDKITEYFKFEALSSAHFMSNNLRGKKQCVGESQLREGHIKQSFIYMLIDPRISCNLPGEGIYLEKFDIWQRFLDAIFYVGKGKSVRPYAHLYDAMKTHTRAQQQQQTIESIGASSTVATSRKVPFIKPNFCVEDFKTPALPNCSKTKVLSKKLHRILDIWRDGEGVVCLHIFHNIMPIDAYTREAAIIDALGLRHLTNMKRGDYYGPAQTWTMRQKKFFGIALLYKAMHIYLAEGESQLSPSDLI